MVPPEYPDLKLLRQRAAASLRGSIGGHLAEAYRVPAGAATGSPSATCNPCPDELPEATTGAGRCWAAFNGEELDGWIRERHVEDGPSTRLRTPVQVPVSVPVLVPVSVPVLGGVSVAQEVTQATKSVKRVSSGQLVPLAAQRAQSRSRMQAVAWVAQTSQEFV